MNNYPVNHYRDPKIPINQPGFHGKYRRCFFFVGSNGKGYLFQSIASTKKGLKFSTSYPCTLAGLESKKHVNYQQIQTSTMYHPNSFSKFFILSIHSSNFQVFKSTSRSIFFFHRGAKSIFYHNTFLPYIKGFWNGSGIEVEFPLLHTKKKHSP